MDREAWHAAVHEVAKSQTQLSDWTELINNCLKQETTQMPFNRWMVKQNMINLYHGILLRNKKEQIIDAFDNLNTVKLCQVTHMTKVNLKGLYNMLVHLYNFLKWQNFRNKKQTSCYQRWKREQWICLFTIPMSISWL